MSVEVIKRNGSKENFNVEKIHKVISWAIDGLDGVSQSDIEITANLSITDGISTREIHNILIRSANDLISEEAPNYQYVAARLLLYSLRKDVWGESEPPRLYEHIVKLVDAGIYDKRLIEKYTESEIHKIGKFINHKRDEVFTYCGIQQLVDKYLIKNRKTGQTYETPQFAYIAIAMVLFSNYPKKVRLDYIKKAYTYLSTFKISLPTPIMSGVRTPIYQYSSCVLADIDDSMESIFSSVSAIGYYTAKRAGIGVNMGRIRPIGSPIRNGEVIHTGVIPFLKVLESTVKSCSQNGIRGGGATVFFPYWHYEIEDIITLKNNAGTDDNRVRKLDYCIQFSKLFYQRLIQNKDITLFSPEECKGLYDSFGTDKFDELYESYEQDKNIKIRKVISARDFALAFSKERLETARIYLMNIDNANLGPWIEKVSMSNLCVSKDTLLLTKNGYKRISDIVNEEVEVWNGIEWSYTTPIKTGDNVKLYRVTLSDGRSLDCTDYHKWYTIKNYSSQARSKTTEKRTCELSVGDKLIKFDFPIIDGDNKFISPYTHGLFCADGTYSDNRPIISLYGEKKNLIPYLDIKSSSLKEDSSGKINVCINNKIAVKYEVPLSSSLSDKLEWLAGFLDGDGCLVISDGNPSIQAVSVNKVFIRKVQLLLDTIGVSSKIIPANEAGMRIMPDHKGGEKEYFCQESERIIITSNGVNSLMSLGFKTNRLKLFPYSPQRDARRFVKVVEIVELDGLHDTYCVNEQKRHMAVFNGILTGNCCEITQPTKPIQHIDDQEGEIGVCVLAAINTLETKLDEYESVCDIIVRMLDEVIDLQEYTVIAAENFTKKRRSLAIGLTNFAAVLASKKVNYEDEQAAIIANELAENLQYYCLKASANLAGEKGPCEKFNLTKYSNGTYTLPVKNLEIEKIVPGATKDWASLWKLIQTNGLRNSTVTAEMPCDSSSVPQNQTNGIEPVRSLLSFRKSKGGLLKQLVPNISKYGKYYTLAFSMKSNLGYQRIVASIQRWMDMSISANAYYNHENYEDKKIPYNEMIKDMVMMYKLGFKTLYYTNSPDGDSEGGCNGGGCSA